MHKKYFGWITPTGKFIETEPYNHLKDIAENDAFDDEIKEKSRQMTSDLEKIELKCGAQEVTEGFGEWHIYEIARSDCRTEIIELFYEKKYVRVGSTGDTIHFELSRNALNRHRHFCKDFTESRGMEFEFEIRK